MTISPVARTSESRTANGAVTETYAAIPEAVSQARALTRSLDESERDTAALVVSELVTNAVQHAETATVTVELTATNAGVSVSVTDDDVRHLPRMTDPPPMGQHGRGLLIVACVCSEVHCEAHEASKTVSAVIERGAAHVH